MPQGAGVFEQPAGHTAAEPAPVRLPDYGDEEDDDDWVPTRPLSDLIFSPSRYFEEVLQFPNYPAWPTRIGYLAAGMLSALPYLAYAVPLPTVRVVVYSLTAAVPFAALNAVFFGLVVAHVGALMMGGKAAIKDTIGGIGLALYWPSIIGVGLTLLLILTDGKRPQRPVADIDILSAFDRGMAATPYLLPIGIIGLACGLWGFVLEVLSISRIHRISLFRAIVALVWLSILIILVLGLAFVLPAILAKKFI